MFVPNIKLVNTSEEVRKNAKTKETIAPVGITTDKSKLFTKLGGILSILSKRVMS